MLKSGDRELLERILRIEREQKARERGKKLERYNRGEKVHEKQLAFHRSLKRNRWVFGGNRSGKTECGAVEAIWLARGNHPYRPNKDSVSGWVVSVSQEVQRDVAQAKILGYIDPDWIERVTMQSGSRDFPCGGIIDTIYVRNVFGGVSSISFKTASQGREKFQGASLDFVWFDEEPPKDIYEECRMRVLDRVGEIFGTMTPLKGLTWVYDEIYLNARDDPEVWWESMEWADNPFLDKDEIARLSESMSSDSLESRKYGRFRANEGLVYPEFDQSVHVIEPFEFPAEWQSGVSIDPGLNNPLSCHFYCQDYDGVIYVVAEHYERGKDVSYHAERILSVADSLGWTRDRDGRLAALIDPAANQRTLASVKSVSELFYEKGIAVNTSVNKQLFAGITRVKEYLGARPPRIYIFKNCVNLIRELKGYWWGDGDAPVKRDDHALDELRYYIMSRPVNKPRAEPKPRNAQYKEKLLRASRLKNKKFQ